MKEYTASPREILRDSFIPAFIVLKDMLVKKLDVAESDWTSD